MLTMCRCTLPRISGTTEAASAKQRATQLIERRRHDLVALSRQLASHPELSFQEVRSAAAVRGALDDFVIDGVADMPTALVARAGNGSLNVGICAEYDALPQLGHACGHNVIAAAAVGAALALRELASELCITVTLLGAPAEEEGGGKIRMLRAGAFDGLHLAVMVHPHSLERDAMATLALSEYRIDFMASDHGDATAAVAMLSAGIAFTREQFRATDRVHGVADPDATRQRASAIWTVRGADLDRLTERSRRLFELARGAALMTACAVAVTKLSPTYADLRTDDRLAALWRRNASLLGRDSFPIQPADPFASTDMGNVSYAMPVIHPLLRVAADGASIHQPAFAAAVAGDEGDKAVIDGATAMAWTLIDVAADPSLRSELERTPYRVADVGPAAYLDFD